jgi:hypothetical protein
MTKQTDFIVFLIIIVLFYLFLSEQEQFLTISETPLGKFIAVFSIILITTFNKYMGVFVCALVILYYQSNIVENMLNMYDFESKLSEIIDESENLDEAINTNVSQSPKKVKFDDEFRNIKEEEENGKYQTEFKKLHCINGILKHKNMEVKQDMVQHVFPELKYENQSCNVCASGCKFSIIESKFLAESNITPKSSTNM